MVLPATDSHGVVAINGGVRNATIVLNRCKVPESENEGDEGATRFAGKHLRKGGRWRRAKRQAKRVWEDARK